MISGLEKKVLILSQWRNHFYKCDSKPILFVNNKHSIEKQHFFILKKAKPFPYYSEITLLNSYYN